MKTQKKEEIQFRYYATPSDFPIFCLQGELWKRVYGGPEHKYLHYHDQTEIGYCLDGLGEMIFNKKHISYTSGDFTIIPARKLHNTVSANEKENHWAYVFLDAEKYFTKFSKIGENKNDIKENLLSQSLCLSTCDNFYLSSILQNILDEFKNQSTNYKEVVVNLLDSFFILLSRKHADFACALCDNKIEKGNLEKALAYISQNYMKQIKIKELAEICFISETQFRRAFSELTGHSPVEYINGYRIKVACGMLKNSNLLIDNIAFNSGFSSTVSFNRNFKYFMATSPMKWRKSQQSKDINLIHYTIDKQQGWF